MMTFTVELLAGVTPACTYISYTETRLSVFRERAREREEKGSGGGTFRGRQEIISPVLKVPRQCPHVLQVEVMPMNGINFYMTLEERCYCEIVMLPL
jgi:hypothetical protein